MNRHDRRAQRAQTSRNLQIFGVGFGGLCGECDEIHPAEPNPFLYTVGLTEQRRPELLLIAPGANVGVAKKLYRLLNELAELQHHRGKEFEDGEHIHTHQLRTAPNCVQLVAIDESQDFPLGAAEQRYGRGQYRVMQVLLFDPAGRLQNDPLSLIAVPLFH